MAERDIVTIRTLLEKPIIENDNADWLIEIPSVIQKHNNPIPSSTKLSPVQASGNEKFFYYNLRDKRQKLKAQLHLS